MLITPGSQRVKETTNPHLDTFLQDLLFLGTDKLGVAEDRTLPSGQGATGIQTFFRQ